MDDPPKARDGSSGLDARAPGKGTTCLVGPRRRLADLPADEHATRRRIDAQGATEMLLITCPWCGPRAHIEFTYGGDATVDRPADPGAVSAEEWLDHVYLRDNPRGPHNEWWQHSSGCRSWIKVRRDTWTHRVHGSGPPGAELGEDEHR